MDMTEVKELEVVETRKLATARLVDSIEPIDGADAIELAVVGGWKTVTKKGDFYPGAPCIYLEVDSFLHDGNAAWQFLVDKQPKMFRGVKGHKLRTIKLRGQISQGLILPPTAFPIMALLGKEKQRIEDAPIIEALTEIQQKEFWEINRALNNPECGFTELDLNLNVLLGVVKWEPPPLNAQLQGMAEGLFPDFIPKTDEERAQNLLPEIFGYEEQIIPANPELNRPEIRRPARGNRNARYERSLKLDGSSMTTFARLDGVMVRGGVCSRNLELKISEANAGNAFVKMAVDSKLLEVLISLCANENLELAVQGELMGPGIQENREQLKENELYVFNIIDIKTRQKLPPYERRALFKRLVELGAKIKHAHIDEEDATLDELGITNMAELLAAAEGPSIKHPVREGYVYKRTDGQFSFKTISNKYLEKQKD